MAEPMAWGVLGAANIALRKVIPGMRAAREARVAAIASRDLGRARAAAETLGIERAHGSYEALLEDPDIEAVYIPLPNHLHVPWSIRAMEAGKHVLCEKPIALDAAEAARLVEARERAGRQVLEAFMARQHPQWRRVRELARSGELGRVGLVQATLAYRLLDPANVRNQAEIGGGGLYDIGCYAVAFARFLFGAEPKRAVALIDRDPEMGVDRLTSGILDFGEGRRLDFTCATQLSPHQTVQALGEKARAEVRVALNAPQGEATYVRVDRTGALDGSGVTVEEIPPCDQYGLQADYATRVFRGEIAPEFPIEDAVANMRAIDALHRSGGSGRWEAV